MTPCAEHSIQRVLCVEAALAKGAESAIAFARSRFLAELHRCSFVSSANQAPQATMVKALASKQRARKGLLVAASRARAAPSGPKSKSKSRVQVQQGAVDLFNGVEKSDLQFIRKGFEKAPQLVPWLASLMRDGVLEKTLRVKLASDQPVQLGKKLGEKMKRFRNLPPRFWGLLWLNLWKEPPSPDSKECKITLEHHQSLAEWALRVNMSGLLPKGHKASQYEGPLLAVLKARHQQCGSKLQELTAQKFNAGAYGYFGLPSPFVGVVSVTGFETVLKVVSEEVARTADDWQIVDNTNFDAALVSATLGISKDLFVLLKRSVAQAEFDRQWPEHDETFELANAEESFPKPKGYEDAIPESAGGSSSGEASASSSEVQFDGLRITPIKKRRTLQDI